MENVEYQAFGKIYVMPEISTVQYAEAMKVMVKNDFGDLTTPDATKLLSIALVEKGTDVWTPEIGKANEELFANFPMKARVDVLKNFFVGVGSLIDLTVNVFKNFPMKKTE